MALTASTFFTLKHPATGKIYKIGTAYIPSHPDMRQHALIRAMDEGATTDEALDLLLEMSEHDEWDAELMYADGEEWAVTGPLEDVLSDMQRIADNLE